jgi:hypothetical protein
MQGGGRSAACAPPVWCLPNTCRNCLRQEQVTRSGTLRPAVYKTAALPAEVAWRDTAVASTPRCRLPQQNSGGRSRCWILSQMAPGMAPASCSNVRFNLLTRAPEKHRLQSYLLLASPVSGTTERATAMRWAVERLQADGAQDRTREITGRSGYITLRRISCANPASSIDCADCAPSGEG